MPDFNEMYVNGAQLVLFDKSVSARDKQNILHSSLYAQLVANKTKATVSDWHHQYDIGIGRSHWVRVSNTTQHVAWPKQSCSLRLLLSQLLADHPNKRAVLNGIDQLDHKLNAKALATLHAAISKPTAEAKPHGLWLQVTMVRSTTDIYSRSLILEGTHCPAGAHWLHDPLPAKPSSANFTVLTSLHQLRADYANIRARVEAALGKWPGQLSVEVLIATDELDTGAPCTLPEPSN